MRHTLHSGASLSAFFIAYATSKLLTVLGAREEKLNSLATGNPKVLREFSERPLRPNAFLVIISIACYRREQLISSKQEYLLLRRNP